ncbi:hypothetical protein NDU88_006943 [Pleurodeles waltl]|uniref:Uncharacterized protein n=1 Tax=Pleurodeles waltl TaxID=8319 RepID=A0AAV7N0N8_PLEWA|nr:hypothetical protein NDU88_006943 [Pleurodeles waltl]
MFITSAPIDEEASTLSCRSAAQPCNPVVKRKKKSSHAVHVVHGCCGNTPLPHTSLFHPSDLRRPQLTAPRQSSPPIGIASLRFSDPHVYTTRRGTT